MNKKITQLDQEIENTGLLEEFQMEELELRFEMRSWFANEQTIEIEPASGNTYLPDGAENVSQETWYGAGVKWTF